MTTAFQVHRIIDGDRVFTDMPASPDNPCTACGACCAFFRVSFYCGELSGGSGGFVPVELTSKVNDVIACMQGTESGHGRCTALGGELGQPGIHCRIYPNRPTTCREFSAWDADGTPNQHCQQQRQRIGLPPLPALPADHPSIIAPERMPA